MTTKPNETTLDDTEVGIRWSSDEKVLEDKYYWSQNFSLERTNASYQKGKHHRKMKNLRVSGSVHLKLERIVAQCQSTCLACRPRHLQKS